MPFTCRYYREALDQFFSNVLQLKSDSQIRNTLIYNYCKHIDYLVTTKDEDIPDICYPTGTKELKYLSKGHHNLIHIFISYFWYRIHNGNPIDNDWVQVTNEEFNDLCMMDYDAFRSLHKAGRPKPMPTSTTS